MKYKVKCTHIISQLRNVQKYANAPIKQNGTDFYIEVNKDSEYIIISKIEEHMSTALRYYTTLIELTEKY